MEMFPSFEKDGPPAFPVPTLESLPIRHPSKITQVAVCVAVPVPSSTGSTPASTLPKGGKVKAPTPFEGTSVGSDESLETQDVEVDELARSSLSDVEPVEVRFPVFRFLTFGSQAFP